MQSIYGDLPGIVLLYVKYWYAIESIKINMTCLLVTTFASEKIKALGYKWAVERLTNHTYTQMIRKQNSHGSWAPLGTDYSLIWTWE